MTMKKFLASIAAGAMIFSAGQALAYFEDLQLIRTVYSTSGVVEVGSDLGAGVDTFAVAPGFVPPTSPVNEFRGDLIDLTTFDGPLSSLVVGYWAHNYGLGNAGEPGRDFYATGLLTTTFGGTDTDGLNMAGKKQQTADATYNATQGVYSSIGGSTVVVNPKTTMNSYYVAFDKSTNASGRMGDNVLADSIGEMTVSLAALATQGYVDQLLYYFDYDGSATTKAGVEVAVIRTFLTSDGTTIDLNGDKIATVINPVPIPAAGWLLGSGLLALIGIRRRNA
jgi:hypothetical protein